ncbi:MAG: asparagine synthase (glutamine-hydrolyzing) [bacterium]|nr:asparagine synthase (glutamine-hydrolyzing) [bacterium]MCM1423618.1 asparagine synthase (glutamine-hydrolyzing) [bacterium]
MPFAMCGICGGNILSRDYEKAIHLIGHRGPDAERVLRFRNVTMGFCRLSIIDLSDAAMQPMTSEDGKVHIVFNGEIYGYKQIREKIKAQGGEGFPFKTESDTEVVLALYSHYGEKFINYIDGMFAIVIYDERKQKLLLYRDRAGIKPLYYYISGEQFLFASELKAVRSMLHPNEILTDNSALYDYFSYGYVPEPKSIYKNVYKLPPAHCMVYDLQKNRLEKYYEYWNLKVNTKARSRRKRGDIYEEYRYLVNKSVNEQMVSDVPVGIFFSGGVDSSIIAWEALKCHSDVESYSIGFEAKCYSEDVYIREYAKQIGIVNHMDILGMEELGEDLYGAYPKWFDEPYDDLTALPTYLLSKWAVKEVKVALSGDGNDELFGGYTAHQSYYEWEKRGIRNRFQYGIEKNILRTETKDLISGLLFYAASYGCFPDRYRKVNKKRLGLPEDYDEYWHFRKFWNTEMPTYTRVRYVDFRTYLLGDILTKTDRSSMAASLEVRVPFLSKELIEFAFSLAAEECNGLGELKGMVKNAYRERLSDELLDRKKHGFTVPHGYARSTRNRGAERRYNLFRDFWREALA